PPALASRRPRRLSTRLRSPSRRASRRTRPTSSRPSSRRPAAPSRSSNGRRHQLSWKGAHRGALPFGVLVQSVHKDCAKMKRRVRTLDKAVRMGEGRAAWRGWPPGHLPRSASAIRARPRAARNGRSLISSWSERGMASRADLARLTGLSRSTVSSLVAEMQATGLVEERHASASGGRPGVLLALSRGAGVVVAADFGHHRLRVAVFDLAHSVLADAV